jgi:hypothetical protein
MPMNQIQFQRGARMLKFFVLYGTEAQRTAVLTAMR